MMELRNWQSQKINETVIDQDICVDNVLSQKLLQILDIGLEEQTELCQNIAESTKKMIQQVIQGLTDKSVA